MQYSPYNPWRKYTSPPRDPLTTTLAAMGGGSAIAGAGSALTGAGGLVSAFSSLVGGNAAKSIGQAKQQEADFEATQLAQNATSDVAAAQRTAQDVKLKAQLLQSSARAGAAAGGINAGTGSALTNQAEIGTRGEYEAMLDMWGGENKATGDLNEAAALRFSGDVSAMEGEEELQASDLQAFSSLGSAGAKMLGTAARIPTV
jgi:hypothetical protein